MKKRIPMRRMLDGLKELARHVARPPRPRVRLDDRAMARLYNGARYDDVHIGREPRWKLIAPP
jgi:hypothetical protein